MRPEFLRSFDKVLARSSARAAILVAAAGIFLAHPFPALASERGPVVRTEQGSLRGKSANGLETFFGVPFATPPVGDLRWREPEAAKPWQGVRDATRFRDWCMQGEPPGVKIRTPNMSEDCLYLNIWKPARKSGRLPVMVWIHGGGFMSGSGAEPIYHGEEFARRDVVLVTINYRLGALGYMAHPELTAESPHHSSGNYGILDQIAALKWIRANIAKFGGDPENVTIFGESAGATAISILQASPLAKGLFDKVIAESTSQFDPAGGLIGRKDLGQAEAYGAAFAEKVGAKSLAELRAMPTDRLLAEPPFFWPTERDGYVLPDLVYNIFAQGKQSDVPTLVGSNALEGSTIRMDWVKPDAAEKAEYDRLYGGYREPVIQTATDVVQWQMRSWAQLQTETGKSKAWLYWFNQPTPGKEELGAAHGAEMIYVFNTFHTDPRAWTDGDRKVANLMTSYWVNFARKGDPNGPSLPYWPYYVESGPLLMELAPQPALIPTPRPWAQDFLDRYFQKRR